MSSAFVDVRREGPVQIITINRPDKKNALLQEMYGAMADALLEADKDPEVRVSILTGAGDDSFTSGNDINDFLNRKSDSDAPQSIRFLQAIVTIEKPLIGAVNGMAFGVGLTMLLHCDLVYASTAARFRAPFVNLGIIPEAGTSLLFPKIMSHQQACEINMLAEDFSGDRAKEFGFVNAVVAPDQLMETALASAKTIAAKPPQSIRLTKELFRKATREDTLARIAEERALYVDLLASDQSKEAITAILEKRAPDFSRFA